MEKRKIKGFRRAFDNDIALRIYAVALAIIVWFILSITLYPTIFKTVTNIPVVLDYEGTYAQGNNLEAIGFEEETVRAQLKGMRYEIGNISRDDLEARVVVDEVRSEGEYELPITIVSKNDADFTVESISMSKIKVKFDRIVSKTFPLEAEAPNIVAAAGFTKDTPILSTNEITVTGPMTQVESISKCVVRVSSTAELEESYSTTQTELVIYSGSAIMDKTFFTFDKTDITLEVPVYMRKELKLTFDIRNTPPNFNVDSLKYTMSVDSIEIAAPNGSIDEIEDIHLGYLDIREIRNGSVFEQDIVLNENYRNLSNVEKVTITFGDSNLASKTFDIDKSKIHVVNASPRASVNVTTQSIQRVMMIGPKYIIDRLTVDDIVAEIDLLNNTEAGSFSRAARIYTPKYNTVWSYGSYFVSLDISTSEN